MGLGRARKGEDIYRSPFGSAAVQNAVLESAEMVQRFGLGKHTPSPEPQLLSPDIVKIKNDTGGQLRLGEVVELQDDVLTDVKRPFPWFTADTPDETKQFAICLTAIPDGKYGLAQIAGICPALVTVNATTDLWAYVSSGLDTLQGDRFWGDVRILNTPAGTGERLVWVKIEQSPQEWLGKADAAIANAASGTASVWTGTPGSEADTTHDIASCYNRGPDIASGDWVTVSRLHRKKYVWLVNCPS